MESVPIIASAFDPSGQLFASAVPSLDLHKVQIHAVTSEEAANTVQAEITLDKGVTVQSLTWATCSSSNKKHQRKKRKRSMNGGEDVSLSKLDEDLVVAIGTNKGTVSLFSPFQSSMIGNFNGAHTVPVTSIGSQAVDSSSLWSCDHSGVIAKWNLITKNTGQKPFSSAEQDVRLVQPVSSKEYPDNLLVASTGIFLIDPANPSEVLAKWPGFVHPVNTIVQCASNPDLFLACSKSERNVNVNSLSQGKTIGVLTAQSDVQSVVLNEDDSACAAVTDEGLVEVFVNPLQANQSKKTSSRRKSGAMALKSVSQFKIVRPQKSTIVKIQNVQFSEDYLTVTWLENASVPVFEKVKWKDVEGENEIVKARRTVTSSDRLANGVDAAAPKTYNEANTHISSGKDVANLESDSENEEDDEEQSTLAERLEALDVEKQKQDSTNNKRLQDPKANLDLSTPGTFTTLLSQALKSNDHSLLETCLMNREEAMIKLSVQRLDSQLAVKLIERVAEKIARAPSEAGNLNIWIKWVMIAHGGYLVSLPNLLKTLSSLHSTLSDRVSTLPRLLALQGRLEMLSSQMELRRDVARKSERDDDELEDEDETEVTYVEDGAYIANGEEESDMDSDDEDEDEDEDEDDEVDDDVNGMLDIEAEEDDFEGLSDMEVDPAEDEGDFDEDSDEEPASAPKKKTNGRSKRK